VESSSLSDFNQTRIETVTTFTVKNSAVLYILCCVTIVTSILSSELIESVTAISLILTSTLDVSVLTNVSHLPSVLERCFSCSRTPHGGGIILLSFVSHSTINRKIKFVLIRSNELNHVGSISLL